MYIVFGAYGYIGRALCDELEEHGIPYTTFKFEQTRVSRSLDGSLLITDSDRRLSLSANNHWKIVYLSWPPSSEHSVIHLQHANKMFNLFNALSVVESCVHVFIGSCAQKTPEGEYLHYATGKNVLLDNIKEFLREKGASFGLSSSVQWLMLDHLFGGREEPPRRFYPSVVRGDLHFENLRRPDLKVSFVRLESFVKVIMSVAEFSAGNRIWEFSESAKRPLSEWFLIFKKDPMFEGRNLGDSVCRMIPLKLV